MAHIEIRHLKSFVAVAEEKNFRAASRRMHVAQPSLTRTIQQLELELDVVLFERSTRVVRITEAGNYLLGEARKLLSHLDHAVDGARSVQRRETGEIFVGFNDFSISDKLPAVIHRYRKENPQVILNLVDATSPDMIEMLIDKRLDIAFLSGVAPTTALEHHVMREEEFVCVLPKGHSLETSETLQLAQLRDEPFIMGTEDWSVYLSVVNRCCSEAGFAPKIVQRAIHSDGIINLVAAGMGVTIYVERDWLHRRNDIAVRKLADFNAEFRTYAVWRRDSQSPMIHRMIDMLERN